MATTPTQMRLTDDDKKSLEKIRRKKKLKNRTDATRYAIEVCVATLEQNGKAEKKVFDL